MGEDSLFSFDFLLQGGASPRGAQGGASPRGARICVKSKRLVPNGERENRERRQSRLKGQGDVLLEFGPRNQGAPGAFRGKDFVTQDVSKRRC